MGAAKMGNSDPLEDEYDYLPMRHLVMPDIKNFATVIFPLKDFAKEKGYAFQVSSPAQERGSIMFNLDAETSFIIGDDRFEASGLEFSVYWRADTADDQALDTIAEQLRQVLAPFGTVTVTAAPPGTRPREESTNQWRRRP